MDTGLMLGELLNAISDLLGKGGQRAADKANSFTVQSDEIKRQIRSRNISERMLFRMLKNAFQKGWWYIFQNAEAFAIFSILKEDYGYTQEQIKAELEAMQ